MINKNLKNIIENGIKDWIEPKIDNSHKGTSKNNFKNHLNDIPFIF